MFKSWSKGRPMNVVEIDAYSYYIGSNLCGYGEICYELQSAGWTIPWCQIFDSRMHRENEYYNKPDRSMPLLIQSIFHYYNILWVSAYLCRTMKGLWRAVLRRYCRLPIAVRLRPALQAAECFTHKGVQFLEGKDIFINL